MISSVGVSTSAGGRELERVRAPLAGKLISHDQIKLRKTISIYLLCKGNHNLSERGYCHGLILGII